MSVKRITLAKLYELIDRGDSTIKGPLELVMTEAEYEKSMSKATYKTGYRFPKGSMVLHNHKESGHVVLTPRIEGYDDVCVDIHIKRKRMRFRPDGGVAEDHCTLINEGSVGGQIVFCCEPVFGNACAGSLNCFLVATDTGHACVCDSSSTEC